MSPGLHITPTGLTLYLCCDVCGTDSAWTGEHATASVHAADSDDQPVADALTTWIERGQLYSAARANGWRMLFDSEWSRSPVLQTALCPEHAAQQASA